MTFSQPSRVVPGGTKVFPVVESSGSAKGALSVLSSTGGITLRRAEAPIKRSPGQVAETYFDTNGSGTAEARAFDVDTPLTLVKVSDTGGVNGCGEFQVTGTTCSSGSPCVVEEASASMSTGCYPYNPLWGVEEPGSQATGSGTTDLGSLLAAPLGDRCVRVKQNSRTSAWVVFDPC